MSSLHGGGKDKLIRWIKGGFELVQEGRDVNASSFSGENCLLQAEEGCR